MDSAGVLLPDVQAKLEEYIESVSEFSIMRISDICYAVKTPPTNTSSLNYVHVTRKGNPQALVCGFGSRCDRVIVTIAKKTRTYSSCPHESLANILEGVTGETCGESPRSIAEPGQETEGIGDNKWLKNTSLYRFNTQKMLLSDKAMQKIEKEILRIIKCEGFPSIQQSAHPDLFNVTFVVCRL